MIYAARMQAASEIGRKLWVQHIIDPPFQSPHHEFELAVINDMIRGPSGLHWAGDPPYQGDGHGREWCGALVSYLLGGVGLAEYWRKYFMSSTERIEELFSYLPHNEHPNPPPEPGKPRRIRIALDSRTTPESLAATGFTPQCGDVGLVGDKGFGYHVVFIDSYANGVAATYEGNSKGKFPDGSYGQGIVRGRRVLGSLNPNGPHLRRFGRFAETDFNA